MKTITKIATLLILVTIGSLGKAQQTLSMCAGSSSVITAVNSASLANPTYSLNPGAITSTNPSFALTSTNSVTYTLYVTGTNTNSAMVTTSSTVAVTLYGVIYSVFSPQNYTLGCASKSVCTLNITNASATSSGVPNGGPVSYTFLPPGSPGVLPTTGTLSSASIASITVPGTWTVVVRDNTNFCEGKSTINITMNNTAPPVGAIYKGGISCYSPTTSVQTLTNSSVLYNWLPMSTQGNTVTVTSNSANPTQSIAVTLTLEITELNNQCQTTTVIPVYQVLYPPNAGIYDGGTSGICQPSVVLTNTSTTGIPAIFSPTASISAILWQGPSPQPTLGLSSTYTAQTSGIYTMTAMDNTNGCIKTATINVLITPVAAYAHTVTNGIATFSDVSTNTVPNTTYFWDFGDGNTSTLQNPIHSYLNAGAHLVKLKIMNPGISCTDSIIQSVAVSGIPCVANSGFSMVPTGTAQVWNVVPNYPWNITAARWDWGDGSSSNTLYTSHQYSAAGMYQICLSVTVSCIASSSTCTSYSVYRGGQAGQILEVNVVPPALISGLSSLSDAEFTWNIAPNPNTGEFRMDLRGLKSETMRVMICDLTGRIVYDRPVDATLTDLTVSAGNLSEGMYLVTIEAGDIKTTRRMVVNR